MDEQVVIQEVEAPDYSTFFEHGIDPEAGYIYIGSGGEDDEVDCDATLAEKVIKGILTLDRTYDGEWITVILNNAGGYDEHGMAIYDILRSCKSKVRVIVFGQAKSIAAWILQAAEERIMSPNSMLMIHDGMVHFEGDRRSVAQEVEFDRLHTRALNQIMLDRIQERWPKYKMSHLEHLLSKDVPLTPGEAIDLGLADRILAFRPRPKKTTKKPRK